MDNETISFWAGICRDEYPDDHAAVKSLGVGYTKQQEQCICAEIAFFYYNRQLPEWHVYLDEIIETDEGSLIFIYASTNKTH